MSNGQVDFFPEAIRELEDGLDWYLERSPQAAEAFICKTDRALAVITAAPCVWSRFEAGTRRYVLLRFPYSIIYREAEVGIVVVAVAHHRKKPRYWHRRLHR